MRPITSTYVEEFLTERGINVDRDPRPLVHTAGYRAVLEWARPLGEA